VGCMHEGRIYFERNFVVRSNIYFGTHFVWLKYVTYHSATVSTDKGNAVPQHTYGGARGGRRYNSYSFMTSALDGGKWSASRPGCTLPPVPIGQEAGWASEPVWTKRLHEKSFASAGDRTWIAWSSSSYPDTILTELPQLLLNHMVFM
jgi:hypothetical protein